MRLAQNWGGFAGCEFGPDPRKVHGFCCTVMSLLLCLHWQTERTRLCPVASDKVSCRVLPGRIFRGGLAGGTRLGGWPE